LTTGISESFLRADDAIVGLLKVGGGDLSRGEMGHRGPSREISWAIGDGFCGIGARRTVSALGGGKLGVVAVESCREVVEVTRFDLVLSGLESWELFLRD
jgi:hypothetical protein